MAEGRDDDECRKRLTAQLLTSPSVILLDNIRRRLDSGALATAITTRTWTDRFLTRSEMVHVPVGCLWIATGNNPALSNEMTRRTVRVRLDAKIDHPWEREGFRHPDLLAWVAEHRGELVWAALTLGQAWIAAGRPEGTRTLGMFESWARTLGGILEVAGIPGFLSNANEFYAVSDAETEAWRTLILEWWDAHRDRDVKVSDLWRLVDPASPADPIPLPIGDGSERSRRTRLGLLLVGARDRVYSTDVGRFRIEKVGAEHNAARWRLAPLSLTQSERGELSTDVDGTTTDGPTPPTDTGSDDSDVDLIAF